MMNLYTFLLFVPAANSFSSGAGGCAKGIPAVLLPSPTGIGDYVGYTHTAEGNERVLMNGTLAEGGVKVTIDDEILQPGEQFDVASDRNYTVTVTATDEPIRGVLIRLESGANSSGYQYDMEGTLEALSETVGNAIACSENGTGTVIGITHIDNNQKTAVSGVLNFYFLDTVAMDITVVMANNDTHSLFYYDGFRVRSLYPSCSLCGEGKVVGNTDGEIVLNMTDSSAGNSSISCSAAEMLASEGQIPPLLCLAAPGLVNETCDCQSTQAPVASTPSPVHPPTKAPSSSAAFELSLHFIIFAFPAVLMNVLFL